MSFQHFNKIFVSIRNLTIRNVSMLYTEFFFCQYQDMDKITQQAIAKAGGVTALAAALGISRQAVNQWKRVPPSKAGSVSKLTGIPVQKLRPDIFGAAILIMRPIPSSPKDVK